MALDVAELLKQNFLDSFEEIKQGLSPVLTSLLIEVRNEFTVNDKEGFWSRPLGESLPCLYQLHDALAECKAYKLQKTSLKKAFFPFSGHGLGRDLKAQLSKLKLGLINIKAEKVNANSSLSSWTASTFPSSRCTCYYESPEASFYLRGIHEQQEEKIVELLSRDGYKAIGIYGMCGTGKTTLVRQVLENSIVQNKYARPIWVCLSDLASKEEMDTRIVKQMLACLNDDPDMLTEETKDDWHVDTLFHELKAKRLKYLVVLDDVWHSNDMCGAGRSKIPFWQALLNDTGGALIVISRLKEVTKQQVKEEILIHLKPLDKENVKAIVKQCMSTSGKEISEGRTLDEIVHHCYGLPLVAKTLSVWIAEHLNLRSGSD